MELEEGAVQREIEDELGGLLDSLDEQTCREMVDEVAWCRVGTLNSSNLWDIAGGVTRPAV